MTLQPSVQTAYTLARERFSELGVDTDAALKTLDAIPISLHCWQGDDVGGFENPGRSSGRRHPGDRQLSRAGPARPTELRADLDRRSRSIPAGSGSTCTPFTPRPAEEGRAQRDLRPSISSNWVDWAKAARHGHGFQSHLFLASPRAQGLHPCASATPASADSGSSTGSPAGGSARISARNSALLASRNLDPRRIQGSPPSIAWRPRQRLTESLDAIFAEPIRRQRTSSTRSRASCSASAPRAYVVGSHEFYLGLRRHAQEAALPGRRTFPSDRGSSPTRSPPSSASSRKSCCT